MAKPMMEYEGKKWRIESDTSIVHVLCSYQQKGVGRSELIVREGTPVAIEKFLAGKKYKLLYSWNVKILTREEMLKNGNIKFRQTVALQAEGINGEGKKFNEKAEEVETGEGETPLNTVSAQQLLNEAYTKTKVKTIALWVMIV